MGFNLSVKKLVFIVVCWFSLFHLSAQTLNQQLFEAICSDEENVSLITGLISKGANVNSVVDGMSLLTHAYSYGKPEVYKLLIDSGANVNDCLIGRITPLALAIMDTDYAQINYLINHGADVNFYCENLPYPVLAINAECNMEIINLLIEQGVNLNVLVYIEPLFYYAYYQCGVELADLFIKNGADINVLFQDEYPILVQSVNDQDTVLFNLLISNNVDVNKKDVIGRTALHYACENNLVFFVKQLISHGADANIRDEFNKLPADITESDDIKALLR
jgi:ankyrin repeat protein